MIARTAVVLTLFLWFTGNAGAEGGERSVAVGQMITLRITGELAVEYARLSGFKLKGVDDKSFFIEATATVAQELEDGRLRLEHSTPILQREEQPRLLTLSATIDVKQIEREKSKAGPVYRAPFPHRPGDELPQGVARTSGERDDSGARVILSDLKDVKLRKWYIAEEAGKARQPQPAR
jgi:hypothetical protein